MTKSFINPSPEGIDVCILLLCQTLMMNDSEGAEEKFKPDLLLYVDIYDYTMRPLLHASL